MKKTIFLDNLDEISQKNLEYKEIDKKKLDREMQKFELKSKKYAVQQVKEIKKIFTLRAKSGAPMTEIVKRIPIGNIISFKLLQWIEFYKELCENEGINFTYNKVISPDNSNIELHFIPKNAREINPSKSI